MSLTVLSKSSRRGAKSAIPPFIIIPLDENELAETEDEDERDEGDAVRRTVATAALTQATRDFQSTELPPRGLIANTSEDHFLYEVHSEEGEKAGERRRETWDAGRERENDFISRMSTTIGRGKTLLDEENRRQRV